MLNTLFASSQKYLNLNTSKCLDSRKWTTLLSLVAPLSCCTVKCPYLKLKSNVVNGDGVFPSIILRDTCQKRLCKVESRDPEDHRRSIVNPILENHRNKNAKSIIHQRQFKGNNKNESHKEIGFFSFFWKQADFVVYLIFSHFEVKSTGASWCQGYSREWEGLQQQRIYVLSKLNSSYSTPAVVAKPINSGLPFFAGQTSVYLYVIIQYLYVSSKFSFF